MVDWNKVDAFERYPKLADELKEIGDFTIVEFQDEGIDVSADKIQSALKEKGHKNIKARDSIVFHVKQDETGKDFEIWLSATSYTNLKELKQIRRENEDTLKGAQVKVSRVSKEDMTQTSFKFEKA